MARQYIRPMVFREENRRNSRNQPFETEKGIIIHYSSYCVQVLKMAEWSMPYPGSGQCRTWGMVSPGFESCGVICFLSFTNSLSWAFSLHVLHKFITSLHCKPREIKKF